MEKIKLYQRVLERHIKDINIKTNKNWKVVFFPTEIEKQRENIASIVSEDGDVVLNGTYLELYFYILGYKQCLFEIANNLLVL
jgi:hypothetical protein